jgi:muramidase (phage lysozyme)
MRAYYWAAGIGAALFVFRNQIEGMMMNTSDALANPNVAAFLATIKHYESNGDYSVLYGGSHFYDYSTHPDIKVPFHNPLRASHADGTPNDWSTAAGAYQINYPTWKVWSVLPGTSSDFSPAAQDALAVAALRLLGALPDVVAGNFASAIDKVSSTWASMPGSKAQQNPAAFASVENTYQQFGGHVA